MYFLQRLSNYLLIMCSSLRICFYTKVYLRRCVQYIFDFSKLCVFIVVVQKLRKLLLIDKKEQIRSGAPVFKR